MFNNDFARYINAFTEVLEEAVTSGEAIDAQARAGVLHVLNDVVPTLAPATGSAVYATKAEVISGAGGGIPEAIADERYAPKTGSLVYAAKSEIPDVSLKANTSDVTTALAGKANVSHTHTGVYQPVGSYLVASDIAGKADSSAVTTALAGKSDTTHTHAGVYQPVGLYLVAADIAGKADNSAVTTALAGKSDTTHTHATLPSAILTTASPSGASDTNVYSALESDARFATVAGAGITQTQADNRYLQLTDAATTYETQSAATTALAGKSDTSHTHTGVYAPATNPALGANNYAGKDYVDAQIATRQVAGTYLTSDDDSAYQTKANMTVVGSETSYYSAAKVDALLAALGGGASKPTHLSARHQSGTVLTANTQNVIPFNAVGSGTGMYLKNTEPWIQYNNTPLTLQTGASQGWWKNTGPDTLLLNIHWNVALLGITNSYMWTWIAMNPGDLTGNETAGGLVHDRYGAGASQHSFSSSVCIKMAPNAVFAVVLQVEVSQTLAGRSYGYEGVTLMVSCHKL